MTMRVLILGNGIGHKIQEVASNKDTEEQATLKKQFEALLRKYISDFKIQFIGEEANFTSKTIALNLGTSWANIHMSEAEQVAKGIAQEQNSRTRFPKYLDEEAETKLTDDGYEIRLAPNLVNLEPRLKSDEIREEYMFRRAIEEAGNAKNIMLICGIIHSEKLADRFRKQEENHVKVILLHYPES